VVLYRRAVNYSTLEEAEIEVIPVKDPHTRIKPLALTNSHGHGRYITVTPERILVSVGECPLAIRYTVYEYSR
jgi:hypothetical protein